MKSKTLLILVISLVIVLGVGGLIYFEPFEQAVTGDCNGGWTTLGINDVTIDGVGDRIRVLGIAKGSECMRIELSAEDINERAESEGLEVNQGVYGTIKLRKYEKTFPIQQTGNTIDTVNLASIGGTFTFCSLSNCMSDYPDTFYWYRDGIIGDCMCVYRDANGLEGEFSGVSQGNFEVEFTFGNDAPIVVVGRNIARDSAFNVQSVNFGNNRIEWVGSLTNLDDVSVPYQYDGRLFDSNWILVHDGIRNSVDNVFDDFETCMSNTDDDFDFCVEDFSYDYGNLLVNQLNNYVSQNSDMIYGADIENNALVVDLKAHPFPAFILDLDAEEVVIVPVEGKPKVTDCVENQELNSGDDEVVTFDVKNDANTNNVEFLGQVQCDDGVTAVIPNFQIDAYEVKTISTRLIPINTNPEKDLSGKCRVTIIDQKSGDSDSCNFNFDVAYVSGYTCDPGKLYCDDSMQNLLKCNDEGNLKVLQKECSLGCELTIEGAKCKGDKVENCTNGIDDDEDGLVDGADEDCKGSECGCWIKMPQINIAKKTYGGDCIIPNIWCHIKNFFNKLKWVFAIVVGLGASLLGGSTAWKLTDKKQRKKKWWLWVGVGVLLGGLAGFLAFLYFWYVLATVLILSIIKAFIPGI
jgi:hypothetical protein